MKRLIVFAFVLFSLGAIAQNKKTSAKNEPARQPVVSGDQPMPWESADSTAYYDSIAAIPKELPIPREFLVYTKKPKQKTERIKLCFNLVSRDTVLNHCINDSLCKDPEVSKVLFERQVGDTMYVLIFVDAFTKVGDDYPQCNSGKETKLVFARWNTKTNKAKWKQKTISSCIRNIANMTKEPIVSWDASSILTVSYYRGGAEFGDIKFDPAQPELGFQGSGD